MPSIDYGHAAYLDMLTTFKVAGLWTPRLQFLHAREPSPISYAEAYT